MLDIKFIRENKELIKEAVRKKCLECDIDKLIKLDEERRRLMSRAEDLRSRQNSANQSISQGQDPETKEKLKKIRSKKIKVGDDRYLFMRYLETSCGCIYMDRG